MLCFGAVLAGLAGGRGGGSGVGGGFRKEKSCLFLVAAFSGRVVAQFGSRPSAIWAQALIFDTYLVKLLAAAKRSEEVS